jgi:hypothetical protein
MKDLHFKLVRLQIKHKTTVLNLIVNTKVIIKMKKTRIFL